MLTEESRKRSFPSLEGRVYLNTAAEGIPPLQVEEALRQYFRDKLLGMDGRDPHFEQWAQARKRIGDFLDLTADEIGICSCSSEAYNLAAMALRLKEGDEVVISDLDFPAGATPWLQPTCPAEAFVWRSREGALRIEDLVALLGPQTRLVQVSLVSFFNGFLIDLPEVIAAVRQHSDALVAVDVTQALGRIPLELSGADLIVSSTHKWILATHGGGIVGVPKERSGEWTVPAGGWFHLNNAFDSNRFEAAVSKPGAPGFMVGMPNFPAIYAIGSALDYLSEIGVETIDRHARPLTAACLEELKKLPVELLTPPDMRSIAGIIAFRHPDAERIHKELRQKNIHVMYHAGRLRIAIHGYNTQKDVDAFLEALHAAM